MNRVNSRRHHGHDDNTIISIVVELVGLCRYYVRRCGLLLPNEYRGLSIGLSCLSVGLSVTLVSPAKTAAPIEIEMPFGLRTRVGQRNHVLDGGPDPLMGRDNLEGEGASHCKVLGQSTDISAKSS